jgi:hypothetical protein
VKDDTKTRLGVPISRKVNEAERETIENELYKLNSMDVFSVELYILE